MTKRDMLRALVVEDEPLARQTLRELLASVPWIRCLGEVADGKSAVARIDEVQPDLLFLDVHMPELSGLEVLNRITSRPAVVFTTAYDHYAIAAFELGAVDYLLKPFGAERFSKTLERVRERLAGSSRDAVQNRLSEIGGAEPLRRIFARDGGAIVPITIDEVVRFEAADDYVVVHVPDGANPVIALPLTELEQRLDPSRFQRVHRAHIVNLDRIEKMEPFDDRRLRVSLFDGSHVIASRAGSSKLRRMLF